MKRVVVAMSLILAACASKHEAPPPTQLVSTGSIAVTANDAIALSGQRADCGYGPTSDLVVQATTASGRCSLLAAGNERRGGRVITLEVYRNGGSEPVAIEAGTYSLDPELSVSTDPVTGVTTYTFADVTLFDADCVPSTIHASAGDFALTAVTATSVAGTAHLELENGGAIEGWFDAEQCSTTADLCAGSVLPANPVCQ